MLIIRFFDSCDLEHNLKNRQFIFRHLGHFGAIFGNSGQVITSFRTGSA